MALFVTAITRNIGRVRFFRSVVTLFRGISCVDSSGWGRVFLIYSSILPALLLLFPSFLGAFSVISALSCHFFGRNRHLSLTVVPAKIIHRSVSLDFMCGGVHQFMSSGDLLIGLLYKKTRS